MSPKFTVLTVAFNAADAVALACESFAARHPDDRVRFWAHDNGSTDGAAGYLASRADRFVAGDRNEGHGLPLNRLCEDYARDPTPYLLIVDTDVEFLGPVLSRLEDELSDPSVGCVCYPSAAGRADLGRCWNFGERLSMPRIDPCVAAFRADAFAAAFPKSLPTGWRFWSDPAVGLVFDVGAAVRYAFEQDGYRVAQPAWLGECVRHYGGLTCYFVEKLLPAEAAARLKQNDPELQRVREGRLALVRSRLAELRSRRP